MTDTHARNSRTQSGDSGDSHMSWQGNVVSAISSMTDQDLEIYNSEISKEIDSRKSKIDILVINRSMYLNISLFIFTLRKKRAKRSPNY